MSDSVSDNLSDPRAASPMNPADEGIWTAIKEALRGSHRNDTAGPIGRSIILLAILMVLETIMESVFAVVRVLLE